MVWKKGIECFHNNAYAEMSFYFLIGYPGQDFDWADYLKQCGAEAAPQSCFPLVSIHSTQQGYSGPLF